ncbi:MAG TPA: YbhB/YbcL family Raf kinase inhibitor-like protein [Deltaproteobacteria bacterium]|nr:YbhB/YbcL family Raf kinase inhibitor-like protein [Deltaproteobacteria bacterium]
MSFELKSSAFGEGQNIPKKYSCEGSDSSPDFSWGQPPAGTQEFVLIADDPDAPAGTWVHWVLYGIPGERRSLPEGISKGDQVSDGGVQGKNSFGFNGYGGPCPPHGKPHRYFFKLYALSKHLQATSPGMSKEQLLAAIQGAVLGETQLMGTFAR